MPSKSGNIVDQVKPYEILSTSSIWRFAWDEIRTPMMLGNFSTGRPLRFAHFLVSQTLASRSCAFASHDGDGVRSPSSLAGHCFAVSGSELNANTPRWAAMRGSIGGILYRRLPLAFVSVVL